ncbi:DNA/RNA non-specific endonuclease [Shewanella sp. AS16]|uniref:DNA/RNA non-specific endonuclease n=1 Tax=Shewanella sp. AS16 TaxID=2907625 RepID=UPI001F3065CE|nr:DNA/RNA non-specific endonuclease [Shewanella sp. AS16]MCE9685814.1 DNA/RNA non-specific endonuclease [Shewanella sp. AS16]
MRLLALFVALLSYTTVNAADTVYSVHCPLGCPQNPTDNRLIFEHLYALSNNSKSKMADWVAYEVDVVNFGESPGRDWSSDPLLPADATLEEADYKNASKQPLEADRGHQAPLASFAGSRYWYELNYLSNITPQDKDLNQGAWKSLEDAERNAVSYRNSLFVITGPLYEKQMPQMPGADEPHEVPSAYYKVIYDKIGNSAAFYMEQSTPRQTNYCTKTITFTELQSKLNYALPKIKFNTAMLKRLGC